MAALGNTVDSGSGASGHYASLNALETAQEQDLTDGGGDTYTATGTTTGDNAADTTAVLFKDWVTAAANYITVKAASGDEAVKTGIDETRYRLTGTDVTIIRTDEEYFRFEGLQVILTVTANNTGHGIYQNTTGGEIRVSNCYIKGTGAGTGAGRGFRNDDATSITKIWNTIITGFYSADETPSDGWLGVFAKGTTVIYNCIVYGCSYGIRNVSETLTVKNTANFGHDTDWNGTITRDYCASDDGGGTNEVAESGGGATWPDDFVDAANGDFTLKATSNLAGAGINDPGSGLYSTDMEGDNYVVDSWSLGVDEIVAAPGGIVVLRRRRM